MLSLQKKKPKVIVAKQKGKKVNFPLYPPIRELCPVTTFVIRYHAIADTSTVTFAIQDGHRQFIVAYTTIAGICYVDSWRITKLEAWSTAGASDQIGRCYLTPIFGDTANNCFNDRAKTIEDSTNSYDRPAHLMWKPSKETPSGGWHITNTVNPTGGLFQYNFTTDSVVDITYQVIINRTLPPNAFTRAIVAGTVGTLYASAVNVNLVPYGVNVI
jgi:hypothetical protein